MKSKLAQFKQAIQQQPTQWLRESLQRPSKYWRQVHFAIIQSELNRR